MRNSSTTTTSTIYNSGSTVPCASTSLDVIIPRSVFGERADKFIDIVARFVKIMSYIIELTTGSEASPTLTYTSTSDPVTGLAMVGVAAWGFLRFYKLVLEVAEKQITLLKTVKEFRGSALKSSTDFEDQIKLIVEEALSKAVESTMASVSTKVPEERVNEIKIAINRDARVVVQAVANGARVGITGVSKMWGDQAASGNWWTVFGVGSNRLPRPDPSAPLWTAHRTCSSKSAPRRDQRICCCLFILRLTKKLAVPSVTDVPTRWPARYLFA